MIFKQKAAWKEAALIFGLSRLTLLLFWYICVTFVPMLTPPKYIASKQCMHLTSNMSCFLLSWWHWDTLHYVEIAHNGYTMLSNTVYFPLFPLLMHSVGFLLGGSTIADYAAGLIIANSCFYGVLVLFYLLVSKDFGHAIAKYTLIYLAFAPYALFFFIAYTESLFLLLTLAVFLFLHHGKPLDWWLAGLCGFLGALTRPTGIILIVPFLVLFIQRFGIRTGAIPKGHTVNWAPTDGGKPLDAHTPRNLLPIGRDPIYRVRGWCALNAILPMAFIPAGLLTYMLYQWITFGNPLLFSAQ